MRTWSGAVHNPVYNSLQFSLSQALSSSLSLTHTLMNKHTHIHSLSLSLCLSLSLSLSLLLLSALSLSSSSTGQRSSCRWSWLSWNCRATFPVVLATSCSISLLNDSSAAGLPGLQRLVPSGCHISTACLGFYGWCTCCHKYVFMI